MRFIDEVANLDNVGGPSLQGVGSSVNNMIQERANFAIQVTRLTADITEDLPYVIFGKSFIQAGYGEILSVPSGVTLSVKYGITQNLTDTIGNYQKVQLVYNDGANTDIVEIVSKGASSYPALLEALASDVFSVSNLRQSISPATSTSQFSTNLAVVSKSIFGKSSTNQLNVDSYKKPEQFQSGIIDIPLSANIDKETAFVGALIQTAGIAVTNSFTVTRIKKFNRNLL
jgi:hypothetical protein